jgi:hypothetical protein
MKLTEKHLRSIIREQVGAAAGGGNDSDSKGGSAESKGESLSVVITKVPKKALVDVMKKGLKNPKVALKMGKFYMDGGNWDSLLQFMAGKLESEKETFDSEEAVMKYIDENSDTLIGYAVEHYNQENPDDEPVKLEGRMRVTRKQLRQLVETHLTTGKSHGAVKIPLEYLTPYLGSLRAMHLWFHGAHNLTKGEGFAGDHVNLYGEIYVALQDDLDAAIEKAIGLSGDERAGCPIELTTYALEILKLYPSPTYAKARDIVSAGIEMLLGHIDLLTELHDTLESKQLLTLGLSDLLAQAANRYEGYLYLLTQRSKVQLG